MRARFAVHDWDSLAWLPEAALVGTAAGVFGVVPEHWPGPPTLEPDTSPRNPSSVATDSSGQTPTDKPRRAGTVAGAVAFVTGGVATIVAAIGDFGSDSSALAIARRNHVDALLIAAFLAALGLMFGGLYPFLRNWDRSRPARVLVAVGVVFVAAGVGVGAFATIDRPPGRLTISLQRSR